MYSEVGDLTINHPEPSSIRILLADSDSTKIGQVIAHVEKQFQPIVRVCQSYNDLLPMLRAECPEVLLLGMFDTLSSFAVCRKCHQLWEHLPIVMLTRQTASDDYFHQFRRTAIGMGATDIVSNDLLHLNRLLQGLPPQLSTTVTNPAGIDTVITMQAMSIALKEITEIGNNYFGPLAQGNYWRKAHARISDRFPVLQNWSADHFGIIACNETILQTQFTTEDLQGLQSWVGGYLSECERIIVDFGGILKNSHLSPAALLLLPDSASLPKTK
jgi:CheY-like chemotaxis protein